MLSRVTRFFAGTPRRSFILYPLLVGGASLARRRGPRVPGKLFLPLLPAGYLLYRETGNYRQRQQAGSRGFERPPDRILQSGPYQFTRNPMYLGHLIFMLGLALSFRSKLAWLILLGNIPWFHARVLGDETRLREKFGAEYVDYCARVKRWLPYVL
jgi:protein-S-isoprenylcysteine O-methyltransferase Ste14